MALKELALKLANRPGQLVRVARILAQEGINLAAISVDSTGRTGHVRMIVSRPDEALGLLTAAGFTVESHDLFAVRLTDEAGSFLKILELLSDAGVNVQSVAILVQREGGQSLVALATKDVAKARRVLQKAGALSATAESLVTNADLLAAAPRIPSESVGLML